MSIKDVIKESVYKSFAGGTELSFWNVMGILVAACLAGIYIYIIFKNFTRREFYSRELNITNAGMAVLVAGIMVAMQSNLLVSFGMVGALSIVRFRTAIKSPVELLFLFWSVSEGIICGVGLHMLGVMLCMIMTVLLFVLNRIPNSKTSALLIIKMNAEACQDDIALMIKKYCKYSKKVSTIMKNLECEMIYEVETKEENELITTLSKIKEIKAINLVDHSGDRRV